MVILCLAFWGIIKLLYTAVVPFYIPTSSVPEFQFLYILSTLSFSIFCNSQPGVRWYVFVVLIYISLVASNEHILLVTDHLYIFFGEMSIQVPCPFLHFAKNPFWVFLLLLSCRNSLYILYINSLSVYDLQIFSPILWVVFSLSLF